MYITVLITLEYASYLFVAFLHKKFLFFIQKLKASLLYAVPNLM